MAVFAVVVIIAIVIISIVVYNKTSESGDTPSGKLTIGEDYSRDWGRSTTTTTTSMTRTVPVKPDTEPHDLDAVYVYRPSSGVWCCVNCECENSFDQTICCVCNMRR